MYFTNKVAIVTGGGAGIGEAISRTLAQHGCKLVIADIDPTSAQSVADEINKQHPENAIGFGGDVSKTRVISEMVALAERKYGFVNFYFANAGIMGAPGLDADEAEWDLSLEVNLRAHIRAAKVLVPKWIEQGEGYFISTASAAGLLTQIGSATYSVTKHAAVGFAEWLSVTYGNQGIKVSCLCPQGVNTKLLFPDQVSNDLPPSLAKAVTSAGEVLEPEQVATEVLRAIEQEKFLILPHPEVLEMYRHKGADYDRWLRGMRRYQDTLRSL